MGNIMYYMKKVFLISFLAFSFSEDIKIQSPKNLENITKLNYSSIEANIKKKEKLIDFINDSFEISDEINLPSKTTYYKIDNDKDINASYIVNSSHSEDFISIASNINTSINTGVYPENNLIIPLIIDCVIKIVSKKLIYIDSERPNFFKTPLLEMIPSFPI